jgi:antitoxin component YwqK of YwqJK toxin-antitoxin module
MNAERTSCVTPDITKVVAATKRGFLVVYYRGNRQVASESYDLNGVLVYCSGSVPDGVVRQYYGNGTVKEETEYEDGCAHGKSTKHSPEGEKFEESTYKRGMRHGPAKA